MLELELLFRSKITFFLFFYFIGVNSLQAGMYDFSHMSVGYTSYDMDYKEPGVMKETSNINDVYGYSASFFYHNIYVLGLEYDSLQGNLEYDGATFSGTPVQTETEDEVWNARLLFGYAVSPESVLYAGYGFRHWFDDLVISYTRTTEYQYVPLGVYYKFYESLPFKIFLSVEYDYFIEGKNKSTLSDTGSGRNDVTLKQSDGYGYRASLEALCVMEPVSLGVDIFYQYWSIEDSESKLSGLGSELVEEPQNNTSILGFTIKVVY